MGVVMEKLIVDIVKLVPPSSIALVVVIIVLAILGGRLWLKFAQMQADRATTKETRDKDSMEIHDKLLKHEFELANLKGIVTEHKTVLDDLRDQMNQLNVNIVELTVVVKEMNRTWRGEK